MQQRCIAVGVICNQHQQVLIAKRKSSQHLANYWEFPGGKLESGESFKSALRRELFEEVGIHLTSAVKIIETQYEYDNVTLRFQLFGVFDFSGNVAAREKQEICWVDTHQLNHLIFPPANKAMIDALILPNKYLIADETVLEKNIIAHVEKQLQRGLRLVQHRAGFNISKKNYLQHSRRLQKLCKHYDATYIANCDMDWLDEVKPDGIHLTSQHLYEIAKNKSSMNNNNIFSASCHDEYEVARANELGVKCILIGPVNRTQSHPNARKLGWKKFSELCFLANMPVFALGGMKLNDNKVAQTYGAQGIAAIRAFL